MLSAQHLRLGLRAKMQGVERTEDHMTGDLHPHGQNSPDIPMSSIQNFFTLRFHFRRDIGMAGSETRHSLSLGSSHSMSLRKWNWSVKKFCIEDIGMSGEF